MYPSNVPPSFSPAAITSSSYYQMATNYNIYGQPLSYSYLGYGQSNSLNQSQAGPVGVGHGVYHAGSYSSSGQPPSVGVVSQTFVSQLSGSDQTYSTYAQALSVRAVGQSIDPQASSNAQIYGYAQPPSVGAVLQTLVSQVASNYQTYTYVQPPSVEAVEALTQTLYSQLYSTYEQAPSVGAVRQTVVSHASGYDQIYSNVQPPSVEAVKQTFVSQPSAREKIDMDEQPLKRTSVGRRSKKDYKVVSEKSNSDLFGKNSGTHQSASSIGREVPSTGKEVSSTGDEEMAMWLGLDAYGHANDETDLFSFPNLEDYKSIARRYRHRRPKEE